MYGIKILTGVLICYKPLFLTISYRCKTISLKYKKMNFQKFTFIIIGFLFLVSCSSEGIDFVETEITSDNQELMIDLQSINDTVSLENIIPIDVHPDSIKPRLNMKSLVPNGDPYFSENMWAIRDLPFTLRARAGAGSSNRFLTTNGKGNELTLSSTANSNKQRFKVKVLPASSGIPYLIYSYADDTPISVGQYSSNPNKKVLFTRQDDSGDLYSASWDLLPSDNYPGHFAIESQSYIGQGSGGPWDVFWHVIELQNSNSIGFSRYSGNAQQEFSINPRNSFQLSSIQYLNEYSATVTKRPDVTLTGSYLNDSYIQDEKDIICQESIQHRSIFSVNKGINFTFTNPAKKFGRPTVLHGQIDLNPSNNVAPDAAFNSSSFTAPISAEVPSIIPGRTKVSINYKVAVYDVEVDFVALATYQDREVKIGGKWRGTVYSDEYPAVYHDYFVIDIDSGQPRSIKIPSNNATNSNPITIQ